MAIADREKRVGLRLPVSVSGRDVAGAPFAEATRSLNISGGGLCFESRQNLGVGSRVSVRIELPPPLRKHFDSKATYRALAVVCRVERYEGESVCRVGARFLEEVEA